MIFIVFLYNLATKRQNGSEISAPFSAHSNGTRSSASENQPSSHKTNQNIVNAKKRQEIFNFVCNNMTNWQDFGRCVGMSDADLEIIAQDFVLRRNVKSITYRILERNETEWGNQFYEKLQSALCDAKRKDIARTVAKLLQKPM